MSTLQHLGPTRERPQDLASLRDTAARVVRARHGGTDEEDLVQEAWTRVAVALRERVIDDPHAYTAGIAANLVRGWDRQDRRRQRRAPFLWIRPTVDPPDGDVVRDEEAAALATALDRLPTSARDVLVAHVVHGLDTATLADAAGTSAGAVAACLARARAMLRVEYVIAFRRMAPPAEHCRRVCYALSANDARREVRLDAAGHIRRCDTCRSIADAVRERRRPAMGAALALRFSDWGARIAQPDWQQAVPRMGVAGGLVGVGAVGALALGGVIALGTASGPPRPPLPPAVVAIAAAPAVPLGSPDGSAVTVISSRRGAATRTTHGLAPAAPPKDHLAVHDIASPDLVTPAVPAAPAGVGSVVPSLPALAPVGTPALPGHTGDVTSRLATNTHLADGLSPP